MLKCKFCKERAKCLKLNNNALYGTIVELTAKKEEQEQRVKELEGRLKTLIDKYQTIIDNIRR